MTSDNTNFNFQEFLEGLKQNPTREFVRASVEKPGTVEKTAVIPLIELIRDKTIDKELRLGWIAQIFWKLEAEAVPILIAHLTDEDFEVRGVCVSALGYFRDRQAVKPVIKLLTDPYERVRCLTAAALGVFKDERAIEPLLLALNDRGEFVISYVMDALVSIGGRAYQAVIEVAKDQKQDKISRSSAIIAIGKFHNPDSLTLLSSLLNDSTEEFEVRHAAAFSLGRIRNPAAIKDLTTALKDPNSEIRAIAASASGDLGNKEAVGPLLQVLKSENDGRVRSIATDSLGQIGDEQIVAELTRVMQTDTAEYSIGMSVSEGARHAISRIQQRDRAQN